MSSPSTRASSKFKSRPSGSSFKRKRGVFESAFQRFGDDANDMQMQSMISNNVKINGGTSNWMLRPMKLPCKFALRKCNCRKKRTAYVDHIGQLPDELLVLILSHLTVKEAVRTSVLSKRWKELWKFITRLNFDDTKMYQDALLDWDLVETGRQRYAGYVHEVLNSHQAGCIEDFRVGSDLATSFWGQIDEWINFALRKRVNRLEVDLRCFCSVEYDHSSDYHSEHNYKITMEKFTSWSFKSLASFVLYKVDVTGCMLESLLSNCPLLERLSIANSKDLVKFKIVGPSIFRLKYLEIRNCSGVKEIEISAAELISFVYSGPNIKFPFRNSTFPTEASVGGLFGKFLVHDTSEELFSCYFSQVTRLTLDFETQVSMFFPSFPELPKVKELELRVVGWYLSNFCTFIIPAESCPSLVKFTFTLYDTWLPLRTKNYTPDYFGRRGLKNLQVLELKGFVGTASEIAMIRFLFRNSVKLRKTTIDPFAPYMKRNPLELIGEEINLRRGRAKRLSTEFPEKVQVVIL